SAANEPELAITMRRLVQVHKIHVDCRPWQLTVELSVQMHERLIERFQRRNPHLCGGERVHPEDQADAVLCAVGLESQFVHGLGRGHDGLGNNPDWDLLLTRQAADYLAR